MVVKAVLTLSCFAGHNGKVEKKVSCRPASCSENVNVIKEALQVTIKSSSSWFISEAVWFSVPRGVVSAGAGIGIPACLLAAHFHLKSKRSHSCQQLCVAGTASNEMGKVQRLGNSAGSAAFQAGSLLSPGELGRRELLLWQVRQLFQKIMRLIKS